MTNTEGKKNSPTATEPIINMTPFSNDGDILWEVNGREKQEIQDIKEKEEDSVPEKDTDTEETTELEPESSEEESQEIQEESEEEKPKKKTLRSSKDRRFADFTRKIKERDALLQEAWAQKENLEQQLIVKEQEKIAAEENTIKTYIENIERAHALALEEGNNEKASEAVKLMAQYAARHETLIKQKSEIVNTSKEKPKAPEPYYPQLATQSEEFQNNGAEWIKKNSWADSKSENFDEEMLEEAENYVNILMKQYKFEGRANEIGKPDFFNQITDYIKESFGISLPPKPQKEKLFSPPKGPSNVAPVNRTGTVPNIKKSNQEIVLTPEQVKIAHSVAGIVKINGQRINDPKTLERMYAQSLKNQMARG